MQAKIPAKMPGRDGALKLSTVASYQARLRRVLAYIEGHLDDPTRTPPADFPLDLCAATDRPVAPNDEGIVAKVIPSGRCAVLRHVGPEESFVAALYYLYTDWLPRSGEELRDFPLYCRRVTFFRMCPSMRQSRIFSCR